jgi:uncharacterized coiled-coil DUF342 family protein
MKVEAEVEESEVMEAEPLEENAQTNERKTIQELKADEFALSEMLIELEGIHADLVKRRCENAAELAKVKKTLEELKNQVDSNWEKAQELLREYNALYEQMTQKTAERALYKKELDEVRREMEELKKVYILVHSDGTVEFDGEDVEIPNLQENEVTAKVAELVLNPEAEELTIKEIKTVAKVFLVVREMNEGNRNFELVFDSTSVQEFYDVITA